MNRTPAISAKLYFVGQKIKRDTSDVVNENISRQITYGNDREMRVMSNREKQITFGKVTSLIFLSLPRQQDLLRFSGPLIYLWWPFESILPRSSRALLGLKKTFPLSQKTSCCIERKRVAERCVTGWSWCPQSTSDHKHPFILTFAHSVFLICFAFSS